MRKPYIDTTFEVEGYDRLNELIACHYKLLKELTENLMEMREVVLKINLRLQEATGGNQQLPEEG